MVLNHEKALKQIKHQTIWKTIKKNKKHVNGIVLNHVEGGFSVGLGGIVAFLPKDQVPPIKYKKKNKRTDKNSFIGSLKTFYVLNISASKSKRNIILSRTEAIKTMIRSTKRRELD
jgi:ribosomal protein S1